MAASVDPLVVGRVIGDVVDMFVPRVSMSVYFGSKHVTNGCDIKPSLAISPPKITISGDPDELYTLVCFLQPGFVYVVLVPVACMHEKQLFFAMCFKVKFLSLFREKIVDPTRLYGLYLT